MVQAVVTFPRAARKPANNKRCGPLSWKCRWRMQLTLML
jgi:hypothetical protein